MCEVMSSVPSKGKLITYSINRYFCYTLLETLLTLLINYMLYTGCIGNTNSTDS